MIEQVSNTSKVIKGMSSQTIVTIVLGVVEIVSFSIMSRLLTQEDFGYYAAITAITVVFATFSETGIGAAIVQQKELSTRYINNAFTISLLFGSFISLLLLVAASPLASLVADETMKKPLMLMSCTLLLNCLSSVNMSLMQRKLQFIRMGMIQLVSLVVTTIIAIWLAYKGYGYYAIITKAVLASVVTYLLSFYFCRTHFGFALDKRTFKRVFSFSGWLMASSLFRNLSHQIDKLLMPSLLSVDALGAYNRPKDFVEQISTKINSIFDTTLFPILSGIQDNRDALNSAFRRSMSLMNTFALLLTMGFMFNSGLLIRIFFGEQWLNLRGIMLIVSCSILFNVDGRLADCYLRALAMTKQQFFFRIFEFVLNTIGVLVCFNWGLMGVAISILITNSIAKIVKIIYIGSKVDVSLNEVIIIILSSWRYAILMLPVCVTSFIFLPNSWTGDIIMTCIFLAITIVVFIFIPKIVGRQYQEEVYVKIISKIKKKL